MHLIIEPAGVKVCEWPTKAWLETVPDPVRLFHCPHILVEYAGKNVDRYLDTIEEGEALKAKRFKVDD